MIEYEGITGLLLQVVPELGPSYLRFLVERERTHDPGDAPPDAVFEEMLVPYLRTLLADKPPTAAKMLASRIFAFLEQLSVATDDEIQRLVDVSICRRLVDDEGTHRLALPFMGPNTRELVDVAIGARQVGTRSSTPPGVKPEA